jgi:hypothetical protein
VKIINSASFNGKFYYTIAFMGLGKIALNVTQVSCAFIRFLKGIEIIGRFNGGNFFLAYLVSTVYEDF